MTVFRALKYILRNRLVILFILFAFIYILSVYYSHNYLVHDEDPSAKTFLLNYPEGQMVGIEGMVVNIYNGGFEFIVYHHGKDTIFKVKSDANVSIGDNVAVFGTLSNNHAIKATNVLLKEYWMYEFLLVRSILALFILILVFIRYWKFDLKNREVIRR